MERPNNWKRGARGFGGDFGDIRPIIRGDRGRAGKNQNMPAPILGLMSVEAGRMRHCTHYGLRLKTGLFQQAARLDLTMNALRICFFAAALGFAIGYLPFGRQMIRGTKKESDGGEFTNRLNVCFYPSMLTEDGLREKKLFFVCLIGVPVSILLGLLVCGLFKHL